MCGKRKGVRNLFSSQFFLCERVLLRRFLADPALALGLLRIPDQKRCHHQRHQNHHEDFIREELKAFSILPNQSNNLVHHLLGPSFLY